MKEAIYIKSVLNFLILELLKYNRLVFSKMFDPEVTASLIKNKRTTLERIEKYISNVYFTDVNLYGKLYPQTKRIDSMFHKER